MVRGKILIVDERQVPLIVIGDESRYIFMNKKYWKFGSHVALKRKLLDIASIK